MKKWTTDFAALVLRLVAGLIFIPHGYPKVFGDGGPAAFAADIPGYGLPAFLGYIAAYAELFGAILLIVGLLTRLDAFLLACTMFVAAFVVALPDTLFEVPPEQNKLLVAVKGIELPLSLFAITFALMFLGPGRFSLDALLRIEERFMSIFRRRAAVPAILSVFLIFATSAPTYIPIAAARQQTQGSTVTVMGLVTVPSGDFSSSSGDQGFAIEDQTAGIWVSIAKKDPRMKLGQKVMVTGPLGMSNGKLQIQPTALQPLAGNQLRVATGQVGAATLGYIITIEGTITDEGVQPDGDYGAKLWLHDGSGKAQVYLNKSTDINPKAPYLKPGKRLRVTGFGNIYSDASFTSYEVDPRSKRDLVPLP